MHENSENNTNLIDRLSQFLDYKDESFNKLAIKIGVSNSYFSKMARNKGSLGSDIIHKIVINYEDLNLEWLFTGVGSMIKGAEAIELSKRKAEDEKISRMGFSELIALIKEKDETIKSQAEEIGMMKEQLATLRQNIPYKRIVAEE
jgi:transcriptional regulator with XRE-family HTH domain